MAALERKNRDLNDKLFKVGPAMSTITTTTTTTAASRQPPAASRHHHTPLPPSPPPILRHMQPAQDLGSRVLS